MSLTGSEFIDVIVNRIEETDSLAYDSNIVSLIQELSIYELYQIIDFGDTTKWHNERINKTNE